MINHNHDCRTMSPPQAVAHNVNELKHDLMTLLGLQWKLFSTDVQQCGHGLRAPLIWIFVAAVLAVGAVPVILLTLAAGLHALGLPLAAALAIAALAALAVAAGMAYFAWRRLSTAADVLQRSREELYRNMESLKELFTQNWPLQQRAAATDSEPMM